MQIQENVPLGPLTTLKVGGPARRLVEARTADEVRDAVHEAARRGWPLLVLGGGSNLVVADVGWPGLALRIAISGLEQRSENGAAIFEAGAGEEWDSLVALSVTRDCAGLECMSGIPGTVGGTPVQNVGAYGQEVSNTIHEVEALDLTSGEVRRLCNPACEFGYRRSLFNTTQRGRYIILRVSFALTPGGPPRLEYADLKKFFAGRFQPPALAEVRDAVRRIRHGKAMLLVAGDEDCRSAGSFFKNPIVSGADYARLSALAAARGLELPRFATPEGVKISAAWLVEQAGFTKGTVRGNVGISRRHALAIVNRGQATAAEIVAFKDEIQQGVQEAFGILLEPEPVFVGFES